MLAKRFVHAAVLAAALIPIGAVSAAATSLDCTFGGSQNCVNGLHDGFLYQFEQYSVELAFDQLGSDVPFTVQFTDFLFTQSEITARFSENFDGYQPLPICVGCTKVDDNGDTVSAEYVEFRVTSSPPVQGTNFIGDYELYIYWLAGTNADFPNPQVLHDLSETDSQFDTLITIAGSYTTEPSSCVFDPDGCGSPIPLLAAKVPGDPGVGGRDNMFTGFTLAEQTVPEPASLILLGTGVSTLLYRRRRRNAKQQ